MKQVDHVVGIQSRAAGDGGEVRGHQEAFGLRRAIAADERGTFEAGEFLGKVPGQLGGQIEGAVFEQLVGDLGGNARLEDRHFLLAVSRLG